MHILIGIIFLFLYHSFDALINNGAVKLWVFSFSCSNSHLRQKIISDNYELIKEKRKEKSAVAWKLSERNWNICSAIKGSKIIWCIHHTVRSGIHMFINHLLSLYAVHCKHLWACRLLNLSVTLSILSKPKTNTHNNL